MHAIPFLLVVLLAVLQALLTATWMTAGVTQQFASVFLGFYGAVPEWTALAFSLGWYWLIIPLASVVWLIFAWRWPAQKRTAWPLAIVSLISFLSMIYAMYPLHLMRTLGTV